MKYLIEGSYNVPEWFDVELDAVSKEEAEDEAIRHIEMTVPESIDIEVESIKELKDNE